MILWTWPRAATGHWKSQCSRIGKHGRAWPRCFSCTSRWRASSGLPLNLIPAATTGSRCNSFHCRDALTRPGRACRKARKLGEQRTQPLPPKTTSCPTHIRPRKTTRSCRQRPGTIPGRPPIRKKHKRRPSTPGTPKKSSASHNQTPHKPRLAQISPKVQARPREPARAQPPGLRTRGARRVRVHQGGPASWKAPLAPQKDPVSFIRSSRLTLLLQENWTKKGPFFCV